MSVKSFDLVLGAILLFAFLLRIYDLEYIHRFVDEVHWFAAVPRVWNEPSNNFLVPFSTLTAFPWTYPYLQAWFVKLLGPSFTSIRLLSAVVGTLNIAALYMLANALFNRKIALIAVFLLAAFPPHIQFSRIALNNIADPLFGTLALAFLAQAMCVESSHELPLRNRTYFVLGGICLGLTQYFYEGGRLLYPLLVYAWLIGALALRELFRRWDKNRETTAKSIVAVRWQHVMLFTIAFLIVAAPVYFTLYRQGLSFTPRLNEMGFDSTYWSGVLFISPTTFLERLPLPPLMFVQRAEVGWFYGGKTALLLWFMVPLFLLGFWHSFWRLRYPGPFLLILWLAATIFGNSLLQTVWWSARYVVIFPALALLVALGIYYTIPLLTPLRNLLPIKAGSWRFNLLNTAGRFALIALLIGSAVIQINYFFTTHVNVYNHQFRFGRDPYDAMFRAVDLPADTHVFLVTDVPIWRLDVDVIINYWDRQYDLTVDVMTSDMVTPQMLQALPVARSHAFFIDPDQWEVIQLVRQYFTLDLPVFSPYSTPRENQFLLYYAPPGAYHLP